MIIVEDSNSPVLDSSGTLLGFLSTHRDITERKQAQAELEKFKLGLERSNSAIFITDAQGVISYVNPAFEKIYGYTREEAIGQTPRIIKSGMVPQDQYKQFWSTLLHGQTVAGEIINKTKDGRLIPIDGSNNPILDQSGNVVGFLGMHTDISERKRSEQQMEETLHETERLYAAVSHESWQAYRQTGKLGEGYVFDQTLIQAASAVWEPEIAQALKQHALITSRSEQRAVAVSPLSVRGESHRRPGRVRRSRASFEQRRPAAHRGRVRAGGPGIGKCPPVRSNPARRRT